METTIQLLPFWLVCMSEGCHNKIDIPGRTFMMVLVFVLNFVRKLHDVISYVIASADAGLDR